jgi:tetratricopeptide (TPR) repeat protein
MNKRPEISRSVRTLTATVLQWFVDRERALHRFREMLAAQDPALALVVRGPTGIGKTWLVRRLHHEADTQGFPSSDIDFASGEAFDDLLMVHRIALALGSRHFDTLNKTLKKATELQVVLKIESSPGGRGVTFLGDAEVHGDVVGGDVIMGNTFNLQADNPETRRIWQERINEAFFADLGHLGLANGAVLQFDSFELATKEASSWVENRLLGRIGEGKLPGVRVLIAGEHVPRFPSAWHGLVEELHLDPLPALEVRRYLRDKRQLVISEANVATIYEITGGRPDLVALIAESNPKELPEQPDVDRLLEILIEGILEKADPPIPETLRVAAIAEWFDAALLVDLLRTPIGVDDRLADLQIYSFVYADERGHLRFSPPVRHVLLKTWAEQQTEFRELHARAARHFDERAHNAADPREREELERQAMGHWLVIDERAGRDRLRALFEENELGSRLAACELLLQRARAIEGLTDLTQDWLRYLQGRLALAQNDYGGSAQVFDALQKETDPGSELHALVGWSRGQVAAERGEWAQAIERYESSVRYFQGQADRAREGQVMLALGDVHLQQARALGGPIRPQLSRRKGRGRFVEAIPAFLVALPFVVYAWAIRRWRFLPPLHHGMNYRNWTLARLLLTAARWYRDAESAFVETGQEAFLVNARQRLAQTYHRLGWWHAARRLFDQVLRSGPVVSNAYRQAQVRKEFADTELAADNTDEAIEQLEDSLHIFERYQDVQSQAQAQALLGQAWMQKGQSEQGLALFRESLDGFSSIDDRLGIGMALHALRRWVQRSDATPEQMDDVEALIASTREKVYLPRVPDRLAAVLEFIVSIGLLLLGAAGLVAQGTAGLTPVSELYEHILSIDVLLGLFGRLVLFTWVFILGSSLLGLLLILWEARQKPRPERLDTIVTDDDAISRYNYRGQELSRIPWREVGAVLSVERVLWRAPIPLLSELCVFGPEAALCVPATMLWYDGLKRDIEDHLREHHVQPVRRQLDVHVLRSWLGLFFVLGPLLLGLQRLIVWNVAELPIPLELVASIAPLLMFLGLTALVVGPYWWLVLYPLWVRYELTPRSRTPLVAGGLGLIIVAFAFFLSYWQPFFPVRNMLDATVHPLGFLLISAAALWMLTAREWVQKLVKRGRPIYQLWIRAGTVIVLLGTVVLGGLFVRQALVPYFYIYRAITYLHRGAYQGTIVNSSQALTMNADLADGYFFRALAYSETGEHQLAVDDLTHLIDARGATVTHYLLFRARAYQALNRPQAACADLKSALSARRWRLSEGEQEKAQDAWREWGCDSFNDVVRDSEGPSP